MTLFGMACARMAATSNESTYLIAMIIADVPSLGLQLHFPAAHSLSRPPSSFHIYWSAASSSNAKGRDSSNSVEVQVNCASGRGSSAVECRLGVPVTPTRQHTQAEHYPSLLASFGCSVLRSAPLPRQLPGLLQQDWQQVTCDTPTMQSL